MGRPKATQYWNQVTKEADGTWKCKHCGREFSGGASRIKAHVDRIPGKGISPCFASPTHDDNQSQESANGMNPGEVAAEDDDHQIVDAFFRATQHSLNIISEPINFPGGSAAVAQSNNYGFESDEIKMLNELLHDLTIEEDDIKGELEWLKSQGKQSKTLVDDWLNKLQQLRYKVFHCLNLVMGAAHNFNESYPHYLRLEIQELTAQLTELKKEKPVVLSKEFVGQDFETYVKRMWNFVGDDQVFMIGIEGMGGVGKTCLATHMETQIKRKGTFNHVFWVTVSRDYSILKLQEDIARRIGVKLNGEDDERTRAAHMSSALSEKGKWVLILDDVWKFIDLRKVGIPRCRINGSKLILTSRLKHVLPQMDCPTRNIIRMHPLSDYHYSNEGLELFLLRLGEDHKTPATLLPEILEIARIIACECGGLPLAIDVMARTMKGIDSIHQWRHALNSLQRVEMGREMEEEVFQVLKLSYDNLMDTCLQNSFLHCALYSDFWSYDKMIMKLVDSGAINGRRSLEEIFDEGHTIFFKLHDHSLVSSCLASMNNSMRNMACHILKESQRCIVRCGKKLTGIPRVQEWSADLELVSLDGNLIEEIPAALANVPSLARLQKLSRLVISDTQVEVVPGLEMLTNLTWLDLSYNSKLRFESRSVLRGLTKLQYLDLFNVGSIHDCKNYNNLVASTWNTASAPKSFLLYLASTVNLTWIFDAYDGIAVTRDHCRSLYFRDCEESVPLLPKDLTNLYLVDNVSWKSLCDALSNDAPFSLMNIEIEYCIEMKSLFCSFGKCSFCTNLNNLQSLRLEHLESLTVICKEDVSLTDTTTQPLKPNAVFSHLKHLEIRNCNGIETLVTAGLLPQLQNLHTLIVDCCESLREIFAEGSNGADSDDAASTITLPNLTTLVLRNLPLLETVCKGIIISSSLPKLEIYECPKLESRSPFEVSSSS